MSNLSSSIDDHLSVIGSLKFNLESLEQVCSVISSCLTSGHKILLFGNGGSAADCQHLASEIIGRFLIERKGFPAIALTTDSSILTAIANDYNYSQIFSRQLLALAEPEDVVIAFSTSGNSPNVIEGIKTANLIGCSTISFTGLNGGALNSFSEYTFKVASEHTPRIQEAHLLLIHLICEHLDPILSSTRHETF
jgi:D-sedoheptulose 7-phosphate isomerase